MPLPVKPVPRRARDLLGRALGLAGITLLMAVLPSATASATTSATDGEDTVLLYDMTVDLDSDGGAHVTLDLDVDFGTEPNHGPFLTYIVKQRFDEAQDRVYRITDVRAESQTAAAEVAVEEDSGWLEIRIGDENREDVVGVHSYHVTYQVEGWVNSAEAFGEEHDELYLNVIGDRWEIPISEARVTVNGPEQVSDALCLTGQASRTPCTSSSHDGLTASFTQEALEPGQELTVAVGFPAGTFRGVEPVLQERWAVDRAFEVTPVTGALAALGLIGGVGAVTVTARRRGRDEQYLGLTPGLTPADGQVATVGGRRRGPVTVQFTPPEGFRAGQLGTLVDEVADPHDVTATIIDLAVRGYLVIEQTESPDERGSGGAWRLARVPAMQDRYLLPFERLLMQEIFAGRDAVNLTDLRTTFAVSMSKVQDALYEDVTTRGWFRGNPKQVRTAWLGAGLALAVLGVVVTAGLAVWTSLALLGVPLAVAGILLAAVSKAAPARTADGTAVLAQALGFQHYLATAEANQLRFEEDEDLFSRYLPFAVAFGLTERWAKLFAELAAQGRVLPEPTWYVGSTYGQMAFWAGAGTLAHDLTSFTHIAEATISAPTPGSSGASGFSGGFSGGGVSGGGGGSW
ncbi:DUF2207 domain-containing protein [Cellulomonas sp. KRMCY2]|uniref:DUF2207 domain-containing protein n=1 Tax=Cellulomonas sp. KRMCY2 TaxID=1304865 RepID=UPI0009DF33DF|nr:DUF2207 domain-containing protein [Cellulomonas sp. KRMCY2]